MVPDKESRRTAVQTLAGCGERQTLGLLAKVAATDKEKEVRQAAFKVLAECPEETPGTTAFLVQCFRAEKDYATKHEMVRAVRNRKLKFVWISELIHFLSTQCSYPYVPTDISDRSPTGNTYKKFEKQLIRRGEFHNVVLTINAMSGQKFTSNDKTLGDIKAWWAANGAEFQKADRELEEQWKEEAKAKKAAAP